MKVKALLKKNIFFYVTELLVGISIMGVEIGASRLIAPYFSSSQIIWTLIIGTIMIAMAIGNFLGGKLADKKPSLARLYLFIAIAGAYISIIPFFGRYVIAGVTALFALFVDNGLLIWSSLTCCLILFVPPLLLLGMVTPSLIKYSMGDKATSGKVVGLLEALSTIGSIIGTFLPTFVTIPTIGTSKTFFLFGTLLLIVPLIYFIFYFIDFFDGRKKGPQKVDEGPKEEKEEKKPPLKGLVVKMVSLSFLVALTALGGVLDFNSHFVFWGESLEYEGESVYNYLQITKSQDGTLSFSTNVMFGVQSMKKADNSLTGMYYDPCLAAPYFAGVENKGSSDILVLGNGTGTYASLLHNDKYFPYSSNITGVEIDQKIIDISKEYFGITDDIETLVCDDGRYYLNHDTGHYDVIMVDAYSSISVPFSMSTVEFFSDVKAHLNPTGVMVLNFNMTDESEGSIDKAIGDTVYSIFDNAITYNTGTNRELFAFNDKALSKENLSSFLSSQSVLTDTSFLRILNRVNSDSVDYADSGIRLTDDNAEVELRSLGAIDGIIKRELSYYRAIYEEKGFWGLLQYLMG